MKQRDATPNYKKQPRMGTVCRSKSDFNKPAKIIEMDGKWTILHRVFDCLVQNELAPGWSK
jgi:hypothetical protein